MVFVAITATVFAPFYAIVTGTSLAFGLTAVTTASTLDVAAAAALIVAVFSFVGITFAATIVFMPAMNGALIGGTVQHVVQGKINYGQAYRMAFRRLGTLILAALLQGLALLVISITVIGIPAAIYLAVRWAFVFQAVVIEGHGVEDAFSRSSALVKGRWWRVFGLLLIWVLIMAAVNSAVSFPLALLPVLSNILQFALELFVTPLMVIFTTLLFFDLRSRKEEFTPEILAVDMGLTQEGQDYAVS